MTLPWTLHPSKIFIFSSFLPPYLYFFLFIMVNKGSFLLSGLISLSGLQILSFLLFQSLFSYFLFFSPHTLLLPSYQHFNILYISILKKKHLSEFHIFLQLLTHFSHIYRKTSWVFYNQSLYFFTSHLLLTYCGLVSYLTPYRSYSHWNKKIKNGLPVTKCSRLLYFYSS